MIEINLLPHREAKRVADLRESVSLLVLGIVVLAGVGYVVDGRVDEDLSSSRAIAQQLQHSIARYKPQQAQVLAFKKKKSELQDKLDVIEGLDRARSGPVRIMDELAIRTPDRLWLTRLKTEDGRIELEGNSLDNGIVADFLRGLNGSDFFSNVDLVKTDEGKAVDGVQLVTFEISAELVTPTGAEDGTEQQAEGAQAS